MLADTPRYQPLSSILEGDESADNGPVHTKPFQIRLGNRAVSKCLERGIARQQECKICTDVSIVINPIQSPQDKRESIPHDV
jgi:hypothetical protein